MSLWPKTVEGVLSRFSFFFAGSAVLEPVSKPVLVPTVTKEARSVQMRFIIFAAPSGVLDRVRYFSVRP